MVMMVQIHTILHVRDLDSLRLLLVLIVVKQFQVPTKLKSSRYQGEICRSSGLRTKYCNGSIS